MLERLPLLQKGSIHGNPYLSGVKTIDPVTDLDVLSDNIRRVTRIKNEQGKVTKGSDIISGKPTDQSIRYYDTLPPFAQRELKTAEDAEGWSHDDINRRKFDRLYMLVKRPGSECWMFPHSGLITQEGGSLRMVGERVASRLLNGFSDGGDVEGVKTEEEKIREEEEKKRQKVIEDEQGEMTLKERRRRRKKLKEMKGNVDLTEGMKAKEEVPQYLHFIGNGPMGVMNVEDSRMYLFRAFVKDVLMVNPEDWGRITDRISENLEGGEVGWFSREEIVEGEMVKDDAGRTKEFLDLLLQD